METNKRISLKLFGWHIYISRQPLRLRKKSKDPRKPIKAERLRLAGYRCEICGIPVDSRCALHHTLPVGAPDRNAVENVTVLCSDCHHELQKRPHYLALEHLEDTTRYDDTQPIK